MAEEMIGVAMASVENSSKDKNWTASIEIDVPFYDVDMMAIVWHGHYIKYFERARCELFNKIGYNYEDMRESGYAWPVIDVHVRYAKPAKFQQKIIVTSTLLEFEQRLKLKYLIVDSVTGNRLTKGYTTQVAVDMKTQKMCYQSPNVLFEKLGVNPKRED